MAEQFLYHWKTFPIVLPPPIAVPSEPLPAASVTTSDGPANGSLSLPRRHKVHVNLRDLFVAPAFDELDAVAVDAKGEPRRLSGKQLEAIRERG